MLDCISGFASSVTRDLVCGAIDELRYPCCFNNLVEDLQKEEDKIVETRSGVQERVDHAKKQTKKIAGLVHNWLKQANTLTDNVEKLLKEAKTNKSCCFGHCPNWIWRYRLGKQLAEKKRIIESCNKEGSKYALIERRASLPGLGYFSSERCLRFESRQPADEQLMKALKCDEVNMIGLYGMGGCGKTTLAIEVGRRAKEDDLFDEVVFAAVSSTVEVQRIQGKIASELDDYELQEKEEMRRAQRLFKKLTQEEKVLVILDDVWQRLDFEAIGIPSSKNHRGCKVLITTRSKDVCIRMDCQRMIELSTLNNEEAWNLFQIQAHISEGTSDTLKQLAKQISDKCEGLPVAITAVASTLKGKAEDDWEVALDKLRCAEPLNIEPGLKNPYKCLRLSYDNLDSEAAKSLFLLCSVFPEDFEIPVEVLTISAIGLGVVGEVRSYKRARNEVSAAISKLIGSCLLSGANEGECVKMHDLVRYVALCIARNEDKAIMCVLEKDVTVEYTLLRFLWCEEFPNQLDCSNLEFLCINTYLEISDDIFKGMEKLRVLFLANKGLERRPLLIKSFKSLTNLRYLLLQDWELGDISFVGDLKKLVSLTLHDCSFLELPNVVVAQTTKLRLLHLLQCDLGRNPFEVIGRLQLEELYIDDRRSEWDLYNESTVEFFNQFSVPQALQRYEIQLGTLFTGYHEKILSHDRKLCHSCFDTSNAAVKDLAKKAEVLFIANIHGGAKNIIPAIFQIGGGCMNELIELLIRDSEDIEHLVNSSNHSSKVGTLFSKLRKLRIEHMEHLGALYHGLPPRGLFEKLEELYVSECAQLHNTLFVWKLNLCSLKVLKLYECPKLTSLFIPVVARSLVRLEKLEILYCKELKHILVDDSREETSTDDDKLVFSKLKQLTVRGCKKLEYVIPVSFAQGLLLLECMEIEVATPLKYIFGECKDRGQLASQNELKIELPLLEKLILVNLPNIINICPQNCDLTWPSLREFALRNCPEFAIVSIIACMVGSKEKQYDHSSTKVKQNQCNMIEVRAIKDRELEGIFKLTGLPIDREENPLAICLQKLSFICNGLIKFMNLENLEQMEVEQMEVSGSPELKCIFSTFIAGALPQLKELAKENSSQPDKIIENEEHQHFLNPHLESSQLEDYPESISIPSASFFNYNSGPLFNLCNLKRLILSSCSKLRSLFSPSTAIRLTSLEELMIAQCHGLRYLVTDDRAHENKEEISQEDHDSQSYVSMFPRLERIGVMNCNLLEYILHVSFAQGLVKLKDIEIRQTPQLRYVFGQSIHDDVHSSHQDQNKIQIELPLLEKIALFCIPNMINICPENYYATCLSLQRIVMDDVGLSTLCFNNLMVYSGSTHSDHSSTSDLRATSMTNGQMLGSVAIWNSSKIKDIFHLDGFPINGQQTTSWLINLNLVNLPELSYIWKGAKHSVTLQNLNLLYIWGCQKLKVIFSASVLTSLPQLKILVVLQCEELEQIIENDEEHENLSSPQSPKICFSKLKLLLVTHCNNLKRLFYLSTSHEFPELEYLIINQDLHLEEVFEGEQGVKEGRVEVLLPKLKHVILMQLPKLNNISQGIEFQTLTNLLVHNCPKLSQTSTTTAEEMLGSYCHDREIDFFVRCDLLYIRDIINKETAEKAMLETTSQLQMSPEDQTACESELPSSQVNASNQSERINKGTQDFQSLEQKLSPISSYNLTESIEETETAIIEKVPESVKLALPTSGSELGMPSTTSLATPLHKIPARKLVDQESTSERVFLDQQHALGETIVATKVAQGIEDIATESVQEGSISEEAMKATLLAGVSLAGVVAAYTVSSGDDMLAQDSQVVEQGDKPNEGEKGTLRCQKIRDVDDSIQEGSNFMDKEGEIGVVSNNSIEVPPGAFADNHISHSLIIAQLGAFKHFVVLDDAQIALLIEAIGVYPHLWNVCEKFSERFQAWKMKTLADMLSFLRNESPISVTPKQEKEFHRLCNEAILLGFERSWVDEMRQRVKVRDHRLDHAKVRLNELLKRHDHLTQELHRIKDEINSLNDFVDTQEKCFDFL